MQREVLTSFSTALCTFLRSFVFLRGSSKPSAERSCLSSIGALKSACLTALASCILENICDDLDFIIGLCTGCAFGSSSLGMYVCPG